LNATTVRTLQQKDKIMPAYIAFLIDIHDHAAFTGYARAVAPTYPSYGGGVALRGPIVEVIEGSLKVEHDTRLVVVEFPSLEQARAWWESEEYRALVKLRESPVSDSRAFLVDGIDLGARS
jgi:uncharacterized protein (DUF1330 family)